MSLSLLIALKLGASYYALLSPRFPCSKSLRAFKDVPEIHLSILYKTFGSSPHCLNRYLKNPKLKTLEVAFINETCTRHTCFPHEILYKNPPRIHKEARSLRRLLRHKRPDTKLIINPLLESQFSRPKARSIFKKLKPYFLDATFIWNPLSPHYKLKPYPLESHGYALTKDTYIANNDGTSVPLKTYASLCPSCSYVFLWLPSFNFRKPNDITNNPLVRTNYPSSTDFHRLNTAFKYTSSHNS